MGFDYYSLMYNGSADAWVIFAHIMPIYLQGSAYYSLLIAKGVSAVAKIVEPATEKIEIVDQPEELVEEARNLPWFLIPVVVVLAAVGAFFLVRLFFGQNEQ
jgi:exosome complex RNA-binding protein Rrp42 (RNase PH superfamily)